MGKLRTSISLGFALISSISLEISAKEVMVRTPAGNLWVIDVQSNDTFLSVIDQIEWRINEEEQVKIAENELGQREFFIDYKSGPTAKLTAKQTNPRNYSVATTDSEKKDIKYIVTTLGNSSLPSIATKKSALKKAGDRIDRVHPFKFLACIFTDEEMKAAMANMQGRAWVWGEFLDGLSSSLSQESKLNNLQPFIQDFANTLGINVSSINEIIQRQSWTTLVDTLIKIIPRQGNTDRYDM